MRDISVLTVALLVAAAVFCYCRKVCKREVSPALSTWIIFFSATLLSFISYGAAENWDVKSGIMNLADTAGDLAIIVCIVFFGKKAKKRLELFEIGYLAAALTITVFWALSNSAFASNLLLQLLLVVGYLPTLQKLLKEKRNTEPMAGWVIIGISALIALYPAVAGGNVLAVVYAGRATVMIAIVLLLMIFYERKNNKGAP